jgi:acetoin utilization deacetylase AcuC-like enzyme
MHGAKNFPFDKERSSLDVPLVDQIGDAGYLATLDEHLPAVLHAADADLVFYLAGVDVVEGDRYGRLDLSEEGLARRDRTVLRAGRRSGTPLVVLMSGGYAESPERTADLHATVHREAREIYGSPIGIQQEMEKTQ